MAVASTCFGANVPILKKPEPILPDLQKSRPALPWRYQNRRKSTVPGAHQCELPTRSLCRLSGRQGHLETDILTHLPAVQRQKTREDERILFPSTSLTGRLVNSPGGRDEFLPSGLTHGGSGTGLKLGLKSYAKTFVHGQILSPSLTQFPYPRKWGNSKTHTSWSHEGAQQCLAQRTLQKGCCHL